MSKSRQSREPTAGIRPIRRIDTGIRGLNEILGGGLIRGSAYIVQGPPGAGKTVMANQVAFRQARDGGRALYMTLLAESFGQMFSHHQNFSYFDYSLVPDRITFNSVYATVRDDGLSALTRLIHRVLSAQRPDVMVLDGLFAAQDARGEPASPAAFRLFVHELATQANMFDCAVLILTNAARQVNSPEYTMVDGWIELNAEQRGSRSVRQLSVHKQRGGPMLRGNHAYQITNDGIVAFPRLESVAPREPSADVGRARLSTGVKGLDTMLQGGLPQRSSTVLFGPTGSGKTTLGLHYLSRSTAEEKGLLFGFFESPQRLVSKAGSIGLDIARLVEQGVVDIRWRLPVDDLMDAQGYDILEAVRETGARRVFIDGVNSLTRLADEERRHSFLRALVDMLKHAGATTLLTREVPQLFFPDALVAQELSGTIDNTFLLHYALDDHAVRRRFSILKLRDSAFDDRSRNFEIDNDGIVLRETGADESVSHVGGAASDKGRES